MIMARLSKESIFASNNEAALNMFSCRCVTIALTYLMNSLSHISLSLVRRETMVAFLSILQDRYGGVEEYIKHHLGMSEHDIAIIRNNLLISSSSRL